MKAVIHSKSNKLALKDCSKPEIIAPSQVTPT